jgi:F0F1-type ATP synthase assembly protein I
MADDRSLSDFLGIGAAAAGILIGCGVIGFFVDLGLGSLPVFVFVGLVVGIAAAVGFIYSRFRDALRGPDSPHSPPGTS